MKQLQMKVANDNGNSAVKMIVDNGEVIISPNVFAKVRDIPNIEEMSEKYMIDNIEDNLLISINSKDGSGTYLVGEYARKSGKTLQNMQLGIFGDKTESKVYPITTIAHIAGQAVKATKGIEDNITVNVEMVGAIPIDHYSKEKANKLADKFYNGNYIVTVHLPNKTVNIKMNFDIVKILPEGVPPVFYLHKQKDEYKKQRILHVNIGEGTTELPLTTDIRFDPNFIEGFNYGVGHAIERILKEFRKQTYMPDNFSRQQFMVILRDEEHKFNAIAEQLIEDELETEAQKIYRVALQEITKAHNEVDYIFIYGGGAILMKPFMKELLEDLASNIGCKIIYADTKDSTTIEVNGMQAFMETKLFRNIKNKMIKDKDQLKGQIKIDESK